MNTINVDESVELTIRCRQHRTFDLAINLGRDLTGLLYDLGVEGRPELNASTDVNGPITIEGTVVHIRLSAGQMDVPTGTYRYELLERNEQTNTKETVLYGWFIIQPAYV